MNGVVFERKWNINTADDFINAISILDDNEFVAKMSESNSRKSAELTEVRRQRKQVIIQAMKNGVISGGINRK